MVTVTTFVFLACASIATMSYATIAMTQAIFKTSPSSPGGSSNPAGGNTPGAAFSSSLASNPAGGEGATGVKLPGKTATSLKGSSRTNTATKPTGDED